LDARIADLRKRGVATLALATFRAAAGLGRELAAFAEELGLAVRGAPRAALFVRRARVAGRVAGGVARGSGLLARAAIGAFARHSHVFAGLADDGVLAVDARHVAFFARVADSGFAAGGRREQEQAYRS